MKKDEWCLRNSGGSTPVEVEGRLISVLSLSLFVGSTAAVAVVTDVVVDKDVLVSKDVVEDEARAVVADLAVAAVFSLPEEPKPGESGGDTAAASPDPTFRDLALAFMINDFKSQISDIGFER